MTWTPSDTTDAIQSVVGLALSFANDGLLQFARGGSLMETVYQNCTTGTVEPLRVSPPEAVAYRCELMALQNFRIFTLSGMVRLPGRPWRRRVAIASSAGSRSSQAWRSDCGRDGRGRGGASGPRRLGAAAVRHRDLRSRARLPVGYGLDLIGGERLGFELGAEGTRRGFADGTAPDHGIILRASVGG